MSETLSAEELVAELNHAEGVLPRHVWNQTIAGNWPRIQAAIEALQAEVTTLRTALEEAAGLFNEMHLPLQGHRASQCTLRTDFCVTAEHVQAALAECLADALEAK